MKVALVGLANTGKSTLFNKLCGKPVSISFDQEGTTIDYISYTVGDKILVDTCGVSSVNDFNDISGQYILNCDLILYVIDGRVPPTNLDIEICRFLQHKKNKTIWLVCNKCENRSILESEAKRIVFEKLFFTSAEHSLGIELLLEALNLEDQIQQDLPLVSIVGRANCGKSTLMNCFVGFDRVKVEDKIGTTRDNVICEAKTAYNKFHFMDTAGYRREVQALEYITRKRRENSLKYTDGAILLLDGQLGLTKVDKQILEEAMKFAKFIIVCINKTDVLTNDPRKNFINFNVPSWFPVIKICAKQNNLGKLKEIIDVCYSKIFTKISTNKLNAFLRTIQHGLRCSENKPLKIKYIFQKANNPIIIAYFANSNLSKQSESFFSKSLANYFDLTGVNFRFERFSKMKINPISTEKTEE